MHYTTIFAVIALSSSASAVPLEGVEKRDFDFTIPGVPVLNLPGLSHDQESESSQVFQKTVTFTLSGRQYPQWPFESRTVNIALEYSYNRGTIEGVPLGIVTAEAKLLKPSAKAAGLITAASWSGDKQKGSEITGTLNLQFRLSDTKGNPTFSFETNWEDSFRIGKKGKDWSEKITAMKRVAAQCEVGFCAVDEIVVLEQDQFSIYVSPQVDNALLD